MFSTPRLRDINNKEQKHRKFACIRNVTIKARYDLYEKYIDKQREKYLQQCDKEILNTRKQVIHRHILNKCMRRKCEEVERSVLGTNAKFGRYNGHTVDEMAGEISAIIQGNHPRIRRQKRLDELKTRAYETGAIMDAVTARDKVKTFSERRSFGRPLKPEVAREFPGVTQLYERGLPPIAKVFNEVSVKKSGHGTSNDVTELDSEMLDFMREKVNKYLDEDIPDDISVSSDVTSLASLHNMTSSKPRRDRPTTLPPIKIGTDNSTCTGEPLPESLTDVITRLRYARKRRDSDVKKKREKWEMKILAEKVAQHKVLDIQRPHTERSTKPNSINRPNVVVGLSLTTPVYSGLKPHKTAWTLDDEI